MCLDTAANVASGSSWFATTSDPQAQDSTGDEEDGCQKGKGFSGLPLGAWALGVDINVLPGKGTTAVDLAEPVDQESECLFKY
jgi:hypothetical protein